MTVWGTTCSLGHIRSWLPFKVIQNIDERLNEYIFIYWETKEC